VTTVPSAWTTLAPAALTASGAAGFDGGAFGHTLLFTALAVVVVLGVTFAVALRVGKQAVIDVTWGLGFVAIAVTAFATSGGHGDGLRRWLALALTAVWGLRLAGHIFSRSRGKGEDPRYEAMLKRADGNPNVHALLHIYLPQGVIMWFVSLPVQIAMFVEGGVGAVLWLGVVVWAVGFFFESVGDLQLTRFRNDPANKGTVLDTGLWRYTRHPNYFGDAGVWTGLFLVAASAWPGVLTILSPAVMVWNLYGGTGKKLLEKDIGDRRPDYADYVRRTSGFFPWPPKPADPSVTKG
jgi:steroid 5-alpha reductase family enzyme